MEESGARRPETPMALKESAAGAAASRELLSVGRGGGIHDTLLINSKHASKKVTNLETVRIPRSNILDRVQSFLPQMALANNELRREMATAPAHQFDIENLDSCLENIIEMNSSLLLDSLYAKELMDTNLTSGIKILKNQWENTLTYLVIQ